MSGDAYSLVKTLHVLGAMVLFGTGIGTAFQMLLAHRSGESGVVARVARGTVRADWLFTTPAMVLQPVTGLVLAAWAGYGLVDTWLVASVALYAVAGLCWFPVVVIQLRMARLAEAAARDRAPLPPAYHRLFRIWFALGWPALAAMLAIIHLMVTKPALSGL